MKSFRNFFKLSISDITKIGMMVATLEAGKMMLSFLPNIEIVSILIIMYTLYFGPKVLYAIFTFTMIEMFLYGFHLWVIMYFYIWPLLALITYLNRKKTGALFWSILSAFFGLFFGMLCAIPYIVTSGLPAAFAFWIAGIPFDLVHCVGNFVTALILYEPLTYVLSRLDRTVFDNE